MIANSIKRNASDAGLVCCDPFCGDVNMWDWEKDSPVAGKDKNRYRFLGLENGIVTIYPRFLANVFFNGHADTITPIQATSLVAIKLIERLYDQKRISQKPSIIYLDSAHEEHETLLELEVCWKALPSKGVLFGDDWSWQAVRNDVMRLSQKIDVDALAVQKAYSQLAGSEIFGNIFLLKGQWILFKP